MTLQGFAAQLDGAVLVVTNDAGDLLAAWHGGGLVNIFDLSTGENVDSFSVCKTDEADDVRVDIYAHFGESDEEEEYE